MLKRLPNGGWWLALALAACGGHDARSTDDAPLGLDGQPMTTDKKQAELIALVPGDTPLGNGGAGNTGSISGGWGGLGSYGGLGICCFYGPISGTQPVGAGNPGASGGASGSWDPP